MESGPETSSRVLRSAKKHRSSPNNDNGKQKKQKTEAPEVTIPYDSPAGRFFCVLELGSASVFEFMSADDVRNLLEICSRAFTQDFLDMVSLAAINTFAVENKIHLGRHCACDWMRGLDFLQSSHSCTLDLPFGVDKTMSIFQEVKGAHDLFKALMLTKALFEVHILEGRSGAQALFTPMICPLLKMKENPSKKALVRAMNSACPRAGSRFFYNFKQKRGRSGIDYLDYHWDDIENESCQFCDRLKTSLSRLRTALIMRERICRKVYRPLKSAMTRDLMFARYIPPPRGLRGSPQSLRATVNPYKGLVAGVTSGGVLCGFYLVNGYKA
ncbi:unnamed protein product [Phytophthora fragariaefolia]|uniref:Unnamed protein product n=1 Tax=Phytophthora fragariaefolia TaxID=1490495 RepID=A0A9W6TTS2_9STRA|nr:unnamed protein product [Phytophthora fragariaefolia]